MNSYRFKCKDRNWPVTIIRRLPNVEDARKYAVDNGYVLMRYLDTDSDILDSFFQFEKETYT